jgi:hypothetical protein
MSAVGDMIGEAVLIGQQPSPKRAARWIGAFAQSIEHGQDPRPLLVTIGALALAAVVALDAATGGRAGLPAPRGILDDDVVQGNPGGGPRPPCSGQSLPLA